MAYERKYKITASVQDSYKVYKELKGKLPRKLYLKIAYELLEIISDMIIRQSLEYKIPHRLGFLKIRKKKQHIRLYEGGIDINKNTIDWKSTKEAWKAMYPDKTEKEIRAIPGKKVIFHTNRHTDGYVMRWYWDKRLCTTVNRTIYLFKPVKGGEFNGNFRGRLGLAGWINHDERKNDWYEE